LYLTAKRFKSRQGIKPDFDIDLEDNFNRVWL